MNRSLVTKRIIPSFAATLFVACGGSDRPGVIVADSAGVRFIEVAWDDVPVQPIDSTPDLLIGEGHSSEALEFYGIRTLTVLRDSTIVVADGSQQIILINPDTRNVTRMGRSGDGPMEFGSLGGIIETANDHLLAVDYGRQRIVELTRNGEVRREMRFPGNSSPGGRPLILTSGTATLETLLVAMIPGWVDSDGRPVRGTGAVLSLADVTDTLASFRGPTTFVGRAATGGVVFGATTLFAGAEDGLWIGDTEGQRVELWIPDQGLRAVVRWSTIESRKVTEHRIAEFWSRLEDAAPPDQRTAIPQMKGILPFADSIPGFDALVVSPSHVWIRSAEAPEFGMLDLPRPPEEWLVVDYRSGQARRLITPARFRLWHAGQDYMLGVRRDELGVETIQRYRLLKLRS